MRDSLNKLCWYENTANQEYCNGKKCYDKKGAITAKNYRYHEAHIELRIYECPDCGFYHLTKTPDLKAKKYD